MHDETDKDYEVPKSSKGDVVHAIARAGIGSLPVVGAAGVELFSQVISPPIENRRNKWMASVADGLRMLEEKVAGFHIEDLGKNEAFISTVMHASHAAIRNHQDEKLNALRNAVLNVAIGRAPSEDMQQIFLDFVDSLTPWHIRILQLFHDPPSHLKQKAIRTEQWYAAGPSTVLEAYFPEMKGERGFYDVLVRELHAKGLFENDTLHVLMTAQGMVAKRTTALGDQFLEFITSPV